MTAAAPPPPQSSHEALFRYLILGQVRAQQLAGQTASRAIREVARREHPRFDGRLTRVSVRTIQRWLKAFSEGGMAALEPRSRARTQTSVVLPEAFIEFIQVEKRQDPRASVPELILRARERGVISAQLSVDRTTVWRACQRMGLPLRMGPRKREADSRRFAYPHRMQCLLCDGKHFRAGASRLKRVALFFLDDATRYALDVLVGSSENTNLFLRGVHRVVEHHGLMEIVFIDQGPGFTSDDTTRVIHSGMGAWLIHGQVGYPEGRGKIERFNRTAWAGVIRGLDGPHVDPDFTALQLRLHHFLQLYNDRPHEGLGGDTPRQRWLSDTRALTFPADTSDLERRFVVTESRKVSKDHVIRHGGKHWEAPRGLAGESVEVHRNVLSGELSVPHNERMVCLQEVDVHANATEPRGRARYPDDDQPLAGEGVPQTAAALSFQRDFASVVGPDGGFTAPEENP